jgi:hypothetical protein
MIETLLQLTNNTQKLTPRLSLQLRHRHSNNEVQGTSPKDYQKKQLYQRMTRSKVKQSHAIDILRNIEDPLFPLYSAFSVRLHRDQLPPPPRTYSGGGVAQLRLLVHLYSCPFHRERWQDDLGPPLSSPEKSVLYHTSFFGRYDNQGQKGPQALAEPSWLCWQNYQKISLIRAYHNHPCAVATETIPKWDLQASKNQITAYQQRVGSALWAAIFSRPDIARACSLLSVHNTNPSPQPRRGIDQVLAYLNSTQNLAIEFRGEQVTDQPTGSTYIQRCLQVASDAAYADDVSSRRSTQGMLIILMDPQPSSLHYFDNRGRATGFITYGERTDCFTAFP